MRIDAPHAQWRLVSATVTKTLLGILFFWTAQEAHANMRRCLLLPVHYETDETLSFKIFEEVENYLQVGHWCRYQSNSAILSIISPQKANRDKYLVREDVLRIIAQKTNTGSLIKIGINPTDKGIKLSMDVIGANGNDIYIRKNTIFERINSYVISRMVKNWLEEYQQTIPYDGMVIGVLGDQFTIDLGSDSELYAGNEVSILRPGKRKRHPLLKEVVEHESIPVGEGKITEVTSNQGQGTVIVYATLGTLKVGDWVKVKENQKREYLQIDRYTRKDNFKFGKIGEWGASFPLGYSHQESQRKGQMTGLGLEFMGELWITRKYWTSLTYGQKFGIFSKQGINSNSRLRFKAGYRYLPLDFFHGPQINAFVGHGHYRYNLKYGDFISFQGLLLGVSCHLPLKKMFALNAEFGFIPSASSSEKASGSNYHLEAGFSYWYHTKMKILSSYDFVNSDVSAANSESKVNVKESRLKMGLSFIF